MSNAIENKNNNKRTKIKHINGDRITLEFAKKEDKRLVYDMLVSPEVKGFMFNVEHPEPTWEEFNQDEPESLFLGEPSEVGNYMLITIDGRVIGSISYYFHSGRLKGAELDIWISAIEYLGKGYGTEAIKLVMEFISTYYNIKQFIIRPWAKNINAIKAYKKCGFREIEVSNLKKYYSDEDFLRYGEGDYGCDETANLVYEIG